MVDQPEGRPKSPGPGKVKQVTKKHSVSKPYERPSSSRGVLARVKELITPVTPGWLKDLVLRPPETTSVTDALEQTVAEVQSVEEKRPNEFKRTLKSLTLPLSEKKTNKKLPAIAERRTPQAKTKSSSILDVTTPNHNTSRTNALEETLGDLKWSSIRPAVKEKYSFSVSAFNTPSKSPNLSAISIHNRSQNNRSTSSPFTNRSKLSFGGTSLQRSLLQQRSNNTSVNDDKKPIKVKPISRSTVRPGVTSNTAKKILEQLESLSKPLGHLPSSRPSTPGSRPCSRASTPLSLSRPSTPQHIQPYSSKSERAIPIRSLTATPLEKAEHKNELMGGGKIKREKTNHYSRMKEEEEEFVVPDFKTVSIPKKEFQPIDLDLGGAIAPKPIKIVNQTQQKDLNHIPKLAAKKLANSPLIKMKTPSPINDDSSTDSSFSFSAPISVTNSALSLSSMSDSAEFSFGAPTNAHNKSIEEILKSTKSVDEILRSVKKEDGNVSIAAREPPGSWSCISCKLSNPSPMTRCSGCEAPNPSKLDGLHMKLNSPIGIKRAPITPMKPASFNTFKHLKEDPTLKFNLNDKKEESEKKESKATIVSFTLPKQTGWSCASCMLNNKEDAVKCIACETAKPGPAKPENPVTTTLKLANMENPLLKFKKTNNWTCDMCMLSNPADLAKCKACETPKPGGVAVAAAPTNPLLAFKQPAGWNCDTCMLRNTQDVAKCKACETPRSGGAAGGSADKAAAPKSVFGSLGSFKQSGWSCITCMLVNDDTLQKCKACQTLKPGVKAEDLVVEKKAEESKPSMFKFGVGAPSSTDAKPSFGSSSGSFDFGSKAETKTTGFAFGAKPEDKKSEAESKTSGFKFGGAGSTEVSKPAFAFGGGNTTSATKTETKPAFNFGGGADKKDGSVPTFSFGGTTAAPKTDAAPSFNFGGVNSDKPAEKPAAPSFNFGGVPSEKKESAPPAFNFGGTPSSSSTSLTFGDKKPDSAAGGFSFGGTSGTSTTAAPTFNFGGGDAKPAPAAVPSFSFGGNAQPTGQAKPPTTAFNFGGGTNTPSTTFQFSNNPAPTVEASGDTMDASSQSPKGYQFGQAKPPTSNGPSFNFGGTTATNKTSAFSSPAPTNTFNFSATNNTTPSFGTTNNNTNAAPTPFAFGQTATNTSTAFNFGGTSAPQPAAPSAFNFSSTNQPAAPTAFNFGGNAAPSFGSNSTQPASNSTPAPTFNFGGSAAAGTATPSASFGSNTTFGTPSQAAAPAFNFGGNTTPSNSTFQFGSPSSTPNSNSNSNPTTNMFNPVSSSTGNRKIRKAVRRTKR